MRRRKRPAHFAPHSTTPPPRPDTPRRPYKTRPSSFGTSGNNGWKTRHFMLARGRWQVRAPMLRLGPGLRLTPWSDPNSIAAAYRNAASLEGKNDARYLGGLV